MGKQLVNFITGGCESSATFHKLKTSSNMNKKKFEDTKRVIRSHKSNNRQYIGQKKKENTMVYKTLHRKPKIKQHEHHNKLRVNSGAPEG